MTKLFLAALLVGQVQEFTGTATSVHDGDTARVTEPDGSVVNVRFLVCDAPEIDQPHGIQSREFVKGLCLGSEFSVRLPILVESPIADPQPVQNDTAAKPNRLRILVVDDNKAAADMLGMVVKMLGNEVRTVYDGSQGIEAAAEFRPDVVLMDLGMPKMNGYEATKRIREQEWGKDMVLVALTGWGQEEDKQRTKEAGFDHHLVKPAEPAALQALPGNWSRTLIDCRSIVWWSMIRSGGFTLLTVLAARVLADPAPGLSSS